MVFQEGDDVPLCMTPQEFTSTKFSHYDELQLKDKTKDELLCRLKRGGVDMYVVEGQIVGKLQDTSGEILSLLQI